MTIPRIITFAALGPDVPPSMAFAAAMVPDKRPGTHWLATGASESEAVAKLEAAWKRDHPDTSKRGAHLRKKPAPVEEIECVL